MRELDIITSKGGSFMENKVVLVGRVESEIKYSHQIKGEIFFCVTIGVKRDSDEIDHVKVIFPEYMAHRFCNEFVYVEGYVRSHNKEHDEMYVLCKYAEAVEEEYKNECYLEGYIVSKSTLRITPTGKKICDVRIAVNRNYHKSDYVQLVFWNDLARCIESSPVGTYIYISGRMQSREYEKDGMTKRVNEISVIKLFDVIQSMSS